MTGAAQRRRPPAGATAAPAPPRAARSLERCDIRAATRATSGPSPARAAASASGIGRAPPRADSANGSDRAPVHAGAHTTPPAAAAAVARIRPTETRRTRGLLAQASVPASSREWPAGEPSADGIGARRRRLRAKSGRLSSSRTWPLEIAR